MMRFLRVVSSRLAVAVECASVFVVVFRRFGTTRVRACVRVCERVCQRVCERV